MKKDNIIYRIIIVYYALTCIFFFYRIQSFTKDILIAPLYFLIPAGIGLLILSIPGIPKKLLDNFTKLQIILIAFFLGFVFIPLLYLQLNNMNNREFLERIFHVLYPALFVLSLYGFYNARQVLVMDAHLRAGWKMLLITTPLFLVMYYFNFMHFASFPLRDIFMEVHFMKGAMELSKYYFINIMTGDTYIPSYQVFNGLLNKFYGYDLVNAQWIFPFYSFAFNIFCIYCFFSSFIKDRFILTVSLFFTVSSFQHFPNTNSQFLFSLSLVLFSLLVVKNRNKITVFPIAVELIGLLIIMIIAYFNRRFPAYASTFFPILFLYLCYLMLISRLQLNKLLLQSVVVLPLLLAVTLHRGVLFFMPLILLLYGMYFVCFQWQVMERENLRYTVLKKVLLFSILSPLVGVPMGMLIYKIYPSSSVILNSLITKIYLFSSGDGDYSHIGIVGVAAEWVRLVPPAFHFIFFILLLGIFIGVKRNYTDVKRSLVESNVRFLMFCTLSLFMLLVIYLSPLPHSQRFVVYPPLIIGALTGFIFKFYFDKGISQKGAILISMGMILYTVIFKFIYDMPWKYQYEAPPYVSALFPIPVIGLAVMAVLVIFLLFAKQSVRVAVLTFIILITGVTVDKFKIISKLYESPYGPVFPEPKIISHYSIVDMDSAKYLRSLLDKSPAAKKTILISDPYTLGIFEAITGNNGFYTFSNLGLMKKEQEERAKAVFRIVFPRLDKKNNIINLHAEKYGDDFGRNNDGFKDMGKAVQSSEIKTRVVMNSLYEYIQKHVGPEMCYAIYKRFSIPAELPVALPAELPIELRELEDNLIWIINEKTIRWTYGDVGYYPMNGTFSDEYLNSYVFPYFDVLLNFRNKVLVLKLK